LPLFFLVKAFSFSAAR
jgi:hypothetical protein